MNTKRISEERYFEIMGGPSKDTLFDACKYAYSKSAKIKVDFRIAVGYTMPRSHPGCAYVPMTIYDVIINGIENEDGSGENFNLCGYCKATIHTKEGPKPYSFKAYYNAKNRSGQITFFE